MFAKSLTALAIFFISASCDEVPEFVSGPTASPLPILEGRAAELSCQTSHPATIRWTLNDEQLSTSARRQTLQATPTTSVLRITRVDRMADSGIFGCEVLLGDGQVSRSEKASLEITWLDYPIVEPESAKDPQKDSDLVLLCTADLGPGDFQYHWFRNSDRLTSKSPRITIKNKKMWIQEASAKDNGVYRCSVHYDGEMRECSQNYVLNMKDPNVPEMVVRPLDVLLQPKATAIFHCQYKMADAVEWFKNDNNVPFENGERVTVHKNGTLMIKEVTRRDEGFYMCVAFKNTEKTQMQKFSAKLKVAYLRALTVQDFEPALPETRVVHAQLDKQFRLTCLAVRDSNPPPLVIWKKADNHLISDKGDVHVDDGTLVLNSAKPDQQGVYWCVQENMAGSHEMAIFVVVNPLPKISKDPLALTVDENQPSNFKCDVTADRRDSLYFDLKKFWNDIVDQAYLKVLNGLVLPQRTHSRKHSGERETAANYSTMAMGEADNPEIENKTPMTKEQVVQKWLDDFNLDLYDLKWKKDGGKVIKEDQGMAKRRVVISPRDGTLKFERTVVSDRGQYWCQLTTLAGHQVSSQPAMLNIKEKLKFYPPPVNKKLELNTSGKVHCKVQGTPTPIVTWYKDFNTSLPDNVMSMNGTLLFSKVYKEHKGNYTCTAVSSQGTVHTTIWIDVVVSPRFIFPMPAETVEVNEGDPVWLHCIVEGDPTPRTQWDRNLNMLGQTTTDDEEATTQGDSSIVQDPDRIKQLENGTLHIKSARQDDSDRYGCTAGNSAGLRREEVSLVVHAGGGVGMVLEDEGVIVKAILITMSVVGAYMLLVVGLMLYCRARRRKRKLANSLANDKMENGELEMKDKEGECCDKEEDKLLGEEGGEAEHRSKNKCNGASGPRAKNGSHRVPGVTGSGASGGDGSEVSKRSGQSGVYDRLILDKECLGDFVQLGRGEFGEVFTASIVDPRALPSEACRTVLVKALAQAGQRDEAVLTEFKRQLDSFSRLRHESVASVIGLCNATHPHYMVFQYTDWGILKMFLLSTRTADEAQRQEKGEPSLPAGSLAVSRTPLTSDQRLAIAGQLAAAMEVIADARIVHKDLAARNCLITSALTVKVAIPALSKDTFSKEYCKHVNQVIPLRWLPHECVYDSDYSTKSDVYMFASTVWEIYHKGELPFIKMNDTTVLTHLKNNTLKWKPHPEMPEALVSLLDSCWDASPKNRPTFTDIVKLIREVTVGVTNDAQVSQEEQNDD